MCSLLFPIMDDLSPAFLYENAFEHELPIDKQEGLPYLHGNILLRRLNLLHTHLKLSVLSFPCVNYNIDLTLSTTTQLTSHIHNFPLTHEISHGLRIILFRTSYFAFV